MLTRWSYPKCCFLVICQSLYIYKSWNFKSSFQVGHQNSFRASPVPLLLAHTKWAATRENLSDLCQWYLFSCWNGWFHLPILFDFSIWFNLSYICKTPKIRVNCIKTFYNEYQSAFCAKSIGIKFRLLFSLFHLLRAREHMLLTVDSKWK